MAEENDLIKLPKEHVGKATGFTEFNTTLPTGNKGAVEELDIALKKDPDVKK
ncbi:hypothetical protein GOV14_02200 [Candidatus Pacearchaeota archaeon]|nr:hypothetical protein [Candidatus Pacearchaeota archaeon]